MLISLLTLHMYVYVCIHMAHTYGPPSISTKSRRQHVIEHWKKQLKLTQLGSIGGVPFMQDNVHAVFGEVFAEVCPEEQHLLLRAELLLRCLRHHCLLQVQLLS